MTTITSNTPLYYQVYSQIKNRIEAGDYTKGDLLPTEVELQNQFRVSRITIRKALEMLSNEGYIVARQGRGTEVLDLKTAQKLNYITSFTETWLEKGYHVSSKNVQYETIIPPSRVASELGIDANKPVLRVYRIRLINDKPIAIMINYILADIAPGIEKYSENIESLYRFLESKYNISLDSAVESISAKAAGTTEAELLQIPEGSPLLVSRRITYSNDRPIEVVVSTIVADKYEYTVYLKGRPG